MRIAIDLDGVVFNIIDPWIANYNQLFNDDLKVNDLTSGSIHKFVKPECGEQLLYGPQLLSNDIILTCDFHEGAKEKVIEIAQKHDVAFLTATYMHHREVRTKRLSIEFNDTQFDLIFTNSKYNYPFDVFIEDSHLYCRQYKQFNTASKVVIVNRPWNIEKPWPDRIDELKDLDLDKLIES